MAFAFTGLKSKLRNVAIWTSAASVVLSSTMVAYAAPSDASLTLGDARTGETTSYTFDVSTVDTGTSLQCIELDLGANSDGTGAISGLDTSSSTYNSGSSDLPTTPASWSVDNGASADDKLRITYATGETPTASGAVVWGNVVNGDTNDTTYYGVFTTYSDSTCTTSVETVTVAFTYTNGQLVSVTVDPSLTFDIYSVASGQASGGETTNVATTDGTVPFGTINTSTNGVAAHDIDVSTNTNGGYDLYLRYTGALTHTGNGTATIDDHSGTYASPSSFPAAGTEAFGYNTSDTDATFSTNYAGFTSSGTGDPVMQNAAATPGTQTERVTYQVGIAGDTDAGTYETTLIYTLVPTF